MSDIHVYIYIYIYICMPRMKVASASAGARSATRPEERGPSPPAGAPPPSGVHKGGV